MAFTKGYRGKIAIIIFLATFFNFIVFTSMFMSVVTNGPQRGSQWMIVKWRTREMKVYEHELTACVTRHTNSTHGYRQLATDDRSTRHTLRTIIVSNTH